MCLRSGALVRPCHALAAYVERVTTVAHYRHELGHSLCAHCCGQSTCNWSLFQSTSVQLMVCVCVCVSVRLVIHNSPSPLTSVSILGCAVCLLQLLLLLPSFNKCIANTFKLSVAQSRCLREILAVILCIASC